MKSKNAKRKKNLQTNNKNNNNISANSLASKKGKKALLLKIIKLGSNLDFNALDMLVESKYQDLVQKCEEAFNPLELYQKINKYVKKETDQIKNINLFYFLRYKIFPCFSKKIDNTDYLYVLQTQLTQIISRFLVSLMDVQNTATSKHQMIDKYQGLLEKITVESRLVLNCKDELEINKQDQNPVHVIFDQLELKVKTAIFSERDQPSVAFKAAQEAIMIFNYFKTIQTIFAVHGEIKIMHSLLENLKKIDISPYCCAFVYNELEKEYYFYTRSERVTHDLFAIEDFFNPIKMQDSIFEITKATREKRPLENMHVFFKEFFTALKFCQQNTHNPQLVVIICKLIQFIKCSKKYFLIIEVEGFYQELMIAKLDNVMARITELESSHLDKCLSKPFTQRQGLQQDKYTLSEASEVIFWDNIKTYQSMLDFFEQDFKQIEQEKYHCEQESIRTLIKFSHVANLIYFYLEESEYEIKIVNEIFIVSFLQRLVMFFNITYEIFMRQTMPHNGYNKFFELLLSGLCIINKIEIILKNDEWSACYAEKNETFIEFSNKVKILIEEYIKFTNNYKKFENSYKIILETIINLKQAKDNRNKFETRLHVQCRDYLDKNATSIFNPLFRCFQEGEAIRLSGQIIIFTSYFHKFRKFKESFDLVWHDDKDFYSVVQFDSVIFDRICSNKKSLELYINLDLHIFLKVALEIIDSTLETLLTIPHVKDFKLMAQCLIEARLTIVIFKNHFKVYVFQPDEKILVNLLLEKLDEILKSIIQRGVELVELNSTLYNTTPPKLTTHENLVVSQMPALDTALAEPQKNTINKPKNRVREIAKAQLLKQRSVLPNPEVKPISKIQNSQPIQKKSQEDVACITLCETITETTEERRARRKAAHEKRKHLKRNQQSASKVSSGLSRRELKRQQQRVQKEEKEAAKLAKEAENELRKREREAIKKLLREQEVPLVTGSVEVRDQATAIVASGTAPLSNATDDLIQSLGSINLSDDEESEMNSSISPLSSSAIEVTSKSDEPTAESENDYYLDFQIEYPEEIQNIFNILTSAGYKCYLRGGFPRDYILKKAFNDYDFVTDCPRDKLLNLLEGFIQCPFEGKENLYQRGDIDIVSYPSLSTNDLKALASQADISLNSLFADKDGKIIDFLKRYKDFGLEEIQVLGDIRTRLALDPNLILRLIRLSNHVDKTITDHDLGIMQEMTPQITNLCPFGVYLKSINDMFSRGEGHKNYLFLLNNGFLPGLLLALTSYEPYYFDVFFENKIMKMDSEGNLTPYKTNLGYDFIALMLLRKILCRVVLADLLCNPTILQLEIDIFWQNYHGEPVKSLEGTKGFFTNIVHKKMEGFLNDFDKLYNPHPHQQQNSYTPGYQTRVDIYGYLQSAPMTVNNPTLIRPPYRN